MATWMGDHSYPLQSSTYLLSMSVGYNFLKIHIDWFLEKLDKPYLCQPLGGRHLHVRVQPEGCFEKFKRSQPLGRMKPEFHRSNRFDLLLCVTFYEFHALNGIALTPCRDGFAIWGPALFMEKKVLGHSFECNMDFSS